MKAFCPTALAVFFLTAGPVLAADEVVDLSELTCQQFVGYDDDNRAIIMMWFEGYYTEDDEPTVIDFGKFASHLTKLLIKCQANPDKTVLEFTDDAMDD
jgi:acid stress chaperone HdeB